MRMVVRKVVLMSVHLGVLCPAHKPVKSGVEILAPKRVKGKVIFDNWIRRI